MNQREGDELEVISYRQSWKALALGLTVIVVVASSSLNPPTQAPQANAFLRTALFTCSSLLTASAVDSIVSSIYNESNGSSSWPPQSGVDSTTWNLFSNACNETAFQVLAQGLGSGNFTLQFASASSGSGSSPTSAALRWSNFTFDWTQGNSSDPLTDTEWWAGNLSSDILGGPLTRTAHRSMWNEPRDQTKTWSGYEWVNPGAAGTYLTTEAAWTNIVPFTAPSCAPPNTNCQSGVPGTVTIDPVGVVWTGLNTTCGKGGTCEPNNPGVSLDTGYVYDQANPSASWCTGNKSGCDNGFYWEVSPYPAYSYTGSPVGAPNDLLLETVFDSGGVCGSGGSGGSHWTTEIQDKPPSGLTRTYTNTICLIEFQPQFAPMIYSVPYLKVAGRWHIQQTPVFSSLNPIVFQSGYVIISTSPPTQDPVVTLWGATPPSVNQYTMNERLSITNTNESFVHPCGYSPIGITTSCQFVEWITSDYTYTYV